MGARVVEGTGLENRIDPSGFLLLHAYTSRFPPFFTPRPKHSYGLIRPHPAPSGANSGAKKKPRARRGVTPEGCAPSGLKRGRLRQRKPRSKAGPRLAGHHPGNHDGPGGTGESLGGPSPESLSQAGSSLLLADLSLRYANSAMIPRRHK